MLEAFGTCFLTDLKDFWRPSRGVHDMRNEINVGIREVANPEVPVPIIDNALSKGDVSPDCDS